MDIIERLEQKYFSGARRTAGETVEEATFQALFKNFYRDAFRAAYITAGCAKMADDAAQEAFIKVFENLNRVRSMDLNQFKRWLVVISVNKAIDQLRKNKKYLYVDQVREGEAGYESLTSPEEYIEQDELKARLSRAVDLLPESYRTTLYLRFFYDLSYREIGRALGIREGSARSRVSRACAMLREIMGDEEGES